MKRYGLYIAFVIVTLLSVTSCTDHDFFTSEDEMVTLSYTVGLAEDARSRTIGDGSEVDVLYIGIYEDGEEVKRLEETINGGEANVEISLFKGREYELVFWAQSSLTSVYNTDDLKNITITYPEQITIQDAVNMDAFFLVQENVTVSQKGEYGGGLILTRPYAMLNIAATGDYEKVQKTELTVRYANETEPMTMTFTGNKADGEHTYLASVLLKPGTITANVRLLGENDEEIKCFDVKGGETLELVANYRYNVIGNVVVEEELPGWDGIIPSESTLTQDEQSRYVIDEEADLAWLSVNASSLDGNVGFLVTKETLDMNSLAISSIQLPPGSTFDGNGKTIKNYANSLFGDATNVTVKNLTLDNVTATSDSHVGVLVNTLTGSGTFTNVSISNSSAATGNGAAGGMIGYITNEEGATLQVTINACTATDNVVNGSETSGIYVGRFRGYDNSETLTFTSDNNESSATTTTGKPSYYVSDNAAVWLRENDYSKYSGFLGDEEFYRGTVNYGDDSRFVVKWDGETTIDPLKDNNTLLIYSAFDLASLQNQNHSSVSFEFDVDMGLEKFVPIKTINNLNGQNHTLYNLYIYEENVTHDGVAFIRTSSGETVHQNLNFSNAIIKATHNQETGNAYGGTLCSYVDGTKYTVENITCTDGKLNAVCKMGGLLGRVGSTEFYCSNNHVNRYTLGNYKVDSNPETFTHTVGPILKDGLNLVVYSVRNLTAHAEATFYPQGEVGGLIGFIVSNYSEIKDCSVKNTQINCYGQEDNTDGINVTGEQKNFLGGWKSNFKMNVKYTIAGRHVNEFIGDIRTISGNEKVYISDCEVENNMYGEGYFKDTHKYNSNENEVKIIGRAYYVGGEFMGYAFGENKGEVYVDGAQVLETASASIL